MITSTPKVFQTASLFTSGSTVKVTAAVRGTDPGSVTWVAKVNDGQWERIGTDDSPSYGMTWDYNLNRNTPLKADDVVIVTAIYKDTSGGLSISKSIKLVIK